MPHIDRVLGKYKAEEFLTLVKRWGCGPEKESRFLKTDLFEEAYGEDQILFRLSGSNLRIFGLDICQNTVESANIKNEFAGFGHNYIRADVRRLPFKNDSFDFILSSSTLDHFGREEDLINSLSELKRALKPRGILIVALNNRHNLNFLYLLKLGSFFRLLPYPVQFYKPSKIKNILKDSGLSVQSEEVIVHIVSPLNTILLLLRRFVDGEVIDRFAQKCVLVSKRLSAIRKIGHLTGWFNAFICVKGRV
ncbi:MAG: class I SAM-dependent methyltransferase [Candidatus Omnitrophota bacterium]